MCLETGDGSWFNNFNTTYEQASASDAGKIQAVLSKICLDVQTRPGDSSMKALMDMPRHSVAPQTLVVFEGATVPVLDFSLLDDTEPVSESSRQLLSAEQPRLDFSLLDTSDEDAVPRTPVAQRRRKGAASVGTVKDETPEKLAAAVAADDADLVVAAALPPAPARPKQIILLCKKARKQNAEDKKVAAEEKKAAAAVTKAAKLAKRAATPKVAKVVTPKVAKVVLFGVDRHLRNADSAQSNLN